MKTSPLFEPLTIGKLRLKNRIILAPMTRGRAGVERVPNDLMADYYRQFWLHQGNSVEKNRRR